MKTYRPTSKGFVSIGTVVDKVLVQCRPNANQALIQIWDHWEAAVGPDVAANARPAAFKGDLLLIHVSNSSWLHHLRFLEKELIRKINLALDGEYIRRVKFKIGPC
jgi:predicted nucleic acid-binding Zn ribbon protein